MQAKPLGAAIDAAEMEWELSRAGPVLSYFREGVGRPVLLLHSMNAAASAYEVSPFFAQMQLQRPLFAPDLPGFGRSERRERDYTPQFYADCIVDMLRKIGGVAADVVALSTTSEFAARAALEAPELFHSLTLVSPTGFSRRKAAKSSAPGRVLKVLRLPLLGDSLFRLLRTRPSIRFFLNKAFADGAPEEMVDYACRSAAQPGAKHAPFYFLSTLMFAADAMGDLYLPLELPVQVLYDKDPNVSLRLLDQIDEARENWILDRIPDTLGLPHFEKPQETQAAVTAFWDRIS